MTAKMNWTAASLRSFEHVLSDKVCLDDSKWAFNVPSIAPASLANQENLILLIGLATSKMRHTITLRYDPVEMNRAIREPPLDQFLLVSFAEFRSIRPSVLAGGDSSVGMQPATGRECTTYMIKLLRSGISLNGRHYNFYGHSNSQLKSRTCYFRAAPKEEISIQIESLGDFSKMKTVAKKAKRVGLLFSTAQVVMSVDPKRVEDISDIVTGDYTFTDGCGLVAKKFAQDLSRRAKIIFRDRRYTPSVFQLRYRGYKGVVTVDPTIPKAGPWLKMRKSMKKFNGGDDFSFAVVDYSKPYTFGYLNDEIIVLLDALGIDRTTLIRKQREHFDFISSACQDARSAFRFCCFLNLPELAERVLMKSLEDVRATIQKLIHVEFEKMLNKREEQKCRILIPKSRLLFGVCDAWGVLKQGQCAVKVTMDGDGQPMALKGMKIIVTRNPCLHPGDLQKLNVVAPPELAHLVDCIVFPVVGRRPAADLMSGGDLDGDTFFVSWDPDIIPTTEAQGAHYPAVPERLQFTTITDEDRLLHFAKYSNASLGRVKNLYLLWARATGAMSPECQELNRLFSQCVDGNMIKESHLEKFKNHPEIPPDAPPFVLDELHDLARDSVAAIKGLGPTQFKDYSFEDMEQLLSRDDLAMSESELTKLSVGWCRMMKLPLHSLLHVFDMNALSPEEKSWIIAQTPPSLEYPRLVFNALCSSQLVHQSELDYFQLSHQAMHWKRIYTSSQDRLATFLDSVSRNIELFHKTMILFRPEERLTLAIYVPQKIPKADNFLVDDRVRLLAFPQTQERHTQSRLSLPTKKGYRLYCDENTFQLFEVKRGNTWVFINRGPSDDSSYRNMSRAQDRRPKRTETLESKVNYDFRASVALDKFSRGLQKHIGSLKRQGIFAAEIYVIGNRDTQSMRYLDLWENMIDSDEKLPLFAQKPRDYDIPLLKNVDWSSQDPIVVEVVHQSNYSLLQKAALTDLRSLLNWLVENCQTRIICECYDHLIVKEWQGGRAPVSTDILTILVEFLPKAPYSSVMFAKFGSWSELSEDISTILQNSGPLLLRSMILAESEHGLLIVAPFQSILDNLRELSLDSFANTVETIALTVHTSDVALELLLGCLEQACDRLLVGRPATIRWFVRNVIAIALEHIGEVQEGSVIQQELLNLRRVNAKEGDERGTEVEISFRIDAASFVPKANTHVRLIAASAPKSSILEKTCKLDGLVLESQRSMVRILCLHPLPSFYEDCSWKLQNCGLFVTTQTMLDAAKKFAILGSSCCGVSEQILGVYPISEPPSSSLQPSDWMMESSLNESQRTAVEAAMSNNCRLLCLWGPPGTGKTQTIVAMIRMMQSTTESRILVTAPTHNAVDNVMRRYLSQLGRENKLASAPLSPLRVSTEVRKVADDLRSFTCDALVGQEIYTNQNAMRKAKKRVKEARIIFTTCMGAGLGLLRGQTFDVVVVDEASQQTEPASLVPLVTGCSKAILVGDHVQLRPSVQNIALAVNFDVSLFEKLYMREGNTPGMVKVMLNKQYRMHSSICTFASREFYQGKLLSGVQDTDRSLASSAFPWPDIVTKTSPRDGSNGRIVLIESAGREDLGQKSKSNQAQADLCVSICKLLSHAGELLSAGLSQDRNSIAVLTPYTRQRQLLEKLLKDYGGIEVSSIDGFQGREADIVIFVTVRCNETGDIGFLKDLRRLNVAVTRARLGLIIVGNRATLGGGSADEESTEVWKRLLGYSVTQSLS